MNWNDDLVKEFARIYCGNTNDLEYLGLSMNEKLERFKKNNKTYTIVSKGRLGTYEVY